MGWGKVWIGVVCPCPPVRNDIVTLRFNSIMEDLIVKVKTSWIQMIVRTEPVSP